MGQDLPSKMNGVSIDEVLAEVVDHVQPVFGQGKVADYIPALARIPPQKFGMAVCGVDGQEWFIGDANECFSIQSISKVFSLLLALDTIGPDRVWERVGREPSGTAFNSLVLLEVEDGYPRNPFINAGALVITDIITAHSSHPIGRLQSYICTLAGNADIAIDDEVARSEAEHGHQNAAIGHLLKSRNNLVSEVDQMLGVYFRQCAISMSCLDLARAFLPLANQGCVPSTGKQFLSPQRVKRINSLLLTCGLYDGVGNFAFRVGIPAKSGVGGGIVGVIPGHLSICVWSPELDELGNSCVGTAALEHFTTLTKLSIF